jgi:hypothetical protein
MIVVSVSPVGVGVGSGVGSGSTFPQPLDEHDDETTPAAVTLSVAPAPQVEFDTIDGTSDASIVPHSVLDNDVGVKFIVPLLLNVPLDIMLFTNFHAQDPPPSSDSDV